MFVEWDPEDGSEKKSWVFDPEDVIGKDAMLIEKQYSAGNYDAWLQGLMVGQVEARAVLLWHMLRQVHPGLKFEDIPQFRVRQLKAQMGVGELKDLWKRAKRIKLKPEQREAFVDQFSEDMADALEREDRDRDSFYINGRGDLVINGPALEPPKREPASES